jgi:hypothetical protein
MSCRSAICSTWGKLQDSVLEARAHVCLPWCQQFNQDRVRAILDLVALLTDLSQVGKRRDAYPLVLTRIENILQLIDQNAFAEAVALLKRDAFGDYRSWNPN